MDRLAQPPRIDGTPGAVNPALHTGPASALDEPTAAEIQSFVDALRLNLGAHLERLRTRHQPPTVAMDGQRPPARPTMLAPVDMEPIAALATTLRAAMARHAEAARRLGSPPPLG
jgi:hypothetical protein